MLTYFALSNDNPDSVAKHESEDFVVSDTKERRYYSSSSQTYILPCDEEEQYRLNMQHILFEKLFDGHVLSSVKNNLQPGSTVVDFGCGTGAWVIDMAKSYPDSTFIGVDIANVFPNDNLPPNVSFSIMDISKPLDFKDNSLDFVNSRLLLGGLKKEKWATMLTEWYRIVKPGGIVQLMEVDFMAADIVPGAERFIKGLHDLMEERGLDFFVAVKLPALLRCNGFNVVERNARKMEFYGTDLSKMVADNWDRLNLGFKGGLVKYICPEDPDSYEVLLEGGIKACIEQRWFKRAVGVVGRKPVV
ncbi:S-adenosyl-L-methionine-dependent methyltransferase [Phycomyces blakesleeanus]